MSAQQLLESANQLLAKIVVSNDTREEDYARLTAENEAFALDNAKLAAANATLAATNATLAAENKLLRDGIADLIEKMQVMTGDYKPADVLMSGV